MTIILFMKCRPFSILMLLMLAWFLPEVRAQERQSDELSISERELIDAKAAYIKGLEEFENGNYQMALDYLTAAYIKLPGFAGVNYALADAYLQIGDLSNAAYYGKQATNLEPENKWYRIKLADIYRSAGRNQATVEELETALRYHPNATDVLFELAGTYANQGQLLKSNEMYNRLLKLAGPDANIFLQKLHNFERLGMADSAVAQLHKISEIEPNSLSTMQMISSYYLKMGRTDEAKTVLRRALDKNGRDPKTLVKLADIYVGEAKWDSVGTLLTSVISDPVVDPEAKLTVAQYLLSRYQQEPDNTQLREEARKLVDQFTRKEPDYAQAHALAASFYAGLQENNKALEALARTNEMMPSNDAAWRQRLQLLLVEGRYAEAVRVGERAAAEVPQDPFILYFWGSACQAEGYGGQAIEKLRQASALPARRPLKSAIYASLGDALAGERQWEEAYSAYETALKLNADNDVVLNNYAYFLAVKGQELDKAEAMILKALELAPDNASYLDTAGWIYYQKGNYDKARKYIQSAVETGAASAEVLEHMGDVLHKLGESQKAREWWQMAFQKDSSRTHLKEKIIR
jgi:tetratricopeptide (TPR) repeat protein